MCVCVTLRQCEPDSLPGSIYREQEHQFDMNSSQREGEETEGGNCTAAILDHWPEFLEFLGEGGMRN